MQRVIGKNLSVPTLALLVFPLMFSAIGYGQSGTSSVHGTVTDPQGKAVVGATVTLKNSGRSFLRTQTSNDSGSYIFTSVPPGLYQIEAEVPGFKKLTIGDIRALVDAPTLVDLQLEIGEITEAVTITAEGAETQINTQDATIGNNFESRQIAQLPLESRNVVQLLSLQPGVTQDGYVTGSRADQANVTLDGVDVNEQQTGLDVVQDLAFNKVEAFSTVLRVTPDSVQEFRVTVTNPNASQGRSSGGQVSLVTKSGTNEIHGSLYEFHRNTATTANDFFNNRTIDPETGTSLPRPKLIRNLFGGSVGGPIKKDRAFFFYNYEGRRDASQQSVVRVVPLDSLGRGEVRFPNGSGEITTLTTADVNTLFPDVGENPAALAVLTDAAKKYAANDFTQGDSNRDLRLNTAGFRFNAGTPLRWDTHIAKLDFNLTQNGKHILFIRGNYQQDVIGGIPQFPDTLAPNFWNHPYGLAVGHTWTLSPTKVNNFRYGITREAFSNQGDSTENSIVFRFAFSRFLDPALRTLSRTTPVHNFIDDFSWNKGNHNIQVGANIRLIRNNRLSFANSYDDAVANPSYYDASGDVLNQPIEDAGFVIAPGYKSPVQTAVTAVIGRFSQYSGIFNFDRSGDILPVGTGVERDFATQEYDWYIQDVWKVHPNLTFTLGLRYGVGRPVYEVNGFEVKPTVSLGDFFERRKASAAAGQPLNEIVEADLAGPANNRPGYYNWDKNNFQPRVAMAWSPDFESGWLRKLFGRQGASVFRGGFAMTNDAFGQQLAVTFDLNNALGFSSTQTIAANTYNVSDRPAPQFTGYNQDIRLLPNLVIPGKLTFPLVVPPDGSQRIEFSLDDTLRTPINYSWNLSFARQLPAGILVEASYIGRAARNLLAQRDVMQLNDLVDPKSKADWYTAMGKLIDLRAQNAPITSVGPIPYFENLFPGLPSSPDYDPGLTATQNVYQLIAREAVGGSNIMDYTYCQSILDNETVLGPHAFFHPQYAALAAWSTIASSDYHAATLSVRQQYRQGLSWGFNYTLSKSMDNASGLQSVTTYGNDFGSGYILNSLRPEDNRSYSDFDIRHIINSHALWQIPVGHGRAFLSQMPGWGEAVLGGWQLTGIYRWNSGLPAPNIFDAAQWATNWNVQSNGVRIRPIESSPTRGGETEPNLFSDPKYAYQSFRNARAGETGDRNPLRNPGFVTLDMGLGKSFKMPWNENHVLQFRWEIFNLTNTQRLRTSADGYGRESYGLASDSDIGDPGPTFGNFDSIQGTPRVMQFGLRYTW
jgi:carboxypeptidase family protein